LIDADKNLNLVWLPMKISSPFLKEYRKVSDVLIPT